MVLTGLQQRGGLTRIHSRIVKIELCHPELANILLNISAPSSRATIRYVTIAAFIGYQKKHMVDIDKLRTEFLDLEFDRAGFVIDAEQSASLAKAYGETRPEFTDPSDPGFQACLPILASLASGRRLPIDFPSLGGISMDGGKAVTSIEPVSCGIQLTGRTHLHDIYAKSGRSGRMVFLVSRMQLYDDSGTHLASTDSRQVIREKPE